jgi:hypothetical protein
MNLWGAKVTQKTISNIDVPEDRDLLITRIALAPGSEKGKAVVVSLVNLESEDGSTPSFVLGTLRAEACEQFEVDINVSNGSSVGLQVTGPGEVHFSGYYNRISILGSDDSYLDSDDDSIDSDDYDAHLNRKVNQYMGGDSSSGEDYEDNQVEEMSSSDDDMDDEQVHPKSPVKPKVDQKIEAKKLHTPTQPSPNQGTKQGNQTPQQQGNKQGSQQTPSQGNKQTPTQTKPQSNNTPKQEKQEKPQQQPQQQQKQQPPPQQGGAQPNPEGKKKKKKE